MELSIVGMIGLFLAYSDFGKKHFTKKDQIFILVFTIYIGLVNLLPMIIEIVEWLK
ncbi:hypothetical protein M2139_001510 [Enterococcus sp. PF1-24]|uniref:hypothetical protein n=1 Tax=unclassified Enterococcus TaxID=2608891 RepID=UPI00247673F8|nr:MULTISPECIES: hypothetical protein [unclassified Enterococcus]MDH6364499.1 hypothetical protein [Enterococcus sp. PFB1-1]MDH6401624.1 hypothetical protein [Enterococcus sp. PF1-24]